MMHDVSPTDPYAGIAEFYDLEHDDFRDDIPFYLNSIAVVGDPVLELGCGTGRLLRAIADAGFRVTGVDRSEPMLERARRSFQAGHSQLVTLSAGSMIDSATAPGGPFGTVIFSLNGLLHLTQPADQREALSSAREALDPRGQLLIDVLNPTLDTLLSYERGVIHEGSWILDGDTQVDKFSHRRVSTSDQLVHTRIWYDLTASDGSVKRFATSFDLRYLHRHELELMLDLAGFSEWQIYGSYELDPYDDSSERLIIAAEITPA